MKTDERKQKKRQRRLARPRGSKTVRVKLTFRCLEYHTIERDVPKAEFEKQRRECNIMAWLEKEYQDCNMSDSDINTESFELDEWKIVKSPNTAGEPQPQKPKT